MEQSFTYGTTLINAAMKTSFLLQDRYMPYYKRSFRSLRMLVGTEELSEKLSFLLFGDNRDNTVAERKHDIIEAVYAYCNLHSLWKA